MIDTAVFISFLFLGNCNMGGFCSPMDTIPNPHVWVCINNGDFINGTDKDLEHNTGEHGSCVMPFLKEMACQYPKLNFVGVRHASAGQKVRDVFLENGHRNHIEKIVKILRQKSVFAGVLMNYGCTEALYDDSVNFVRDYINTIEWIRNISENELLPIIIGRFESLGDIKAWEPKTHSDVIVRADIELLPKVLKDVFLSPNNAIPKEDYCNNHCYNENGYKFWAKDASTIYKNSHFDSWKGR
jgi:hypothetical protein